MQAAMHAGCANTAMQTKGVHELMEKLVGYRLPEVTACRTIRGLPNNSRMQDCGYISTPVGDLAGLPDGILKLTSSD